jgi:hypothetical protein
VRAVVALAVSGACLAAAVLFYRHRDGVLHALTRDFDRQPPGPRRRYQAGPRAQIDMALPVVAMLVVAVVFLVVGLAEF